MASNSSKPKSKPIVDTKTYQKPATIDKEAYKEIPDKQKGNEILKNLELLRQTLETPYLTFLKVYLNAKNGGKKNHRELYSRFCQGIPKKS
jgi:hypothetical protein